MKNEIIKLAQEKCKEYLKEKSITYHPSYVWLCQYIAEQVYEQILKDAVEGEIHPDDCEIWVNLVGYGYKFNEGDKVRIIVCKKEDEK